MTKRPKTTVKAKPVRKTSRKPRSQSKLPSQIEYRLPGF